MCVIIGLQSLQRYTPNLIDCCLNVTVDCGHCHIATSLNHLKGISERITCEHIIIIQRSQIIKYLKGFIITYMSQGSDRQCDREFSLVL